MSSVIVKEAGHVPFQVRAYLESGFTVTMPWGIALDGLLAAEVWAAQKHCAPAGVSALSVEAPPDLDLPLARCVPAESAADWHWAATCAWPGAVSRSQVRYWHAFPDSTSHTLETVDPELLPSVLGASRGRWRKWRMPFIVTATSAVTWTGVGDLNRVQELLEPVMSIGKRRHTGEGTVLEWEFVELPPATEAHTVAHLHADGTLGRPSPTGCVSEGCVTGGDGWAGLRPPYVHPSRQRHLALPHTL